MCLGRDYVMFYTVAGEEQNGIKHLHSCSTSHTSGLCSVNVIVGLMLVRRLELFDDLSLWAMLVMPS